MTLTARLAAFATFRAATVMECPMGLRPTQGDERPLPDARRSVTEPRPSGSGPSTERSGRGVAEDARIGLQSGLIEQHEDHFADLRIVAFEVARDGVDGDARGIVHRIAVHAGADRRERNGPDVVFFGESQTGLIAGSERFRL